MSPDDWRNDDWRIREGGTPDEGKPGVPGQGALGEAGAIVSRLPAPPNARVDGVDVRAARLAAFLAGEVDVRPAGAGPSGQPNCGARILAASRARATRRKQVRRRAGFGVAMGALAAAGFVAWTMGDGRTTALSYTIDGAPPPAGGLVRSSDGHEPQLAFSDGTNMRVLPRSRARVIDVGRRGARLMLEDGRAHVQVAHRPGADWQIQAGAYVIHVHGTAFFVEWSAAQSRLDVQMESGVVSVDGPRAGDTLILRAGESLSVRPDGGRVVTTMQPTPSGHGSSATGVAAPPVLAAAPSLAPKAPAEAPVEAPLGSPRPQPVATAPLLPRSAPWSERLADGEAAAIVAEAQRRGIGNVLAGASSEDLAALADAARFRKQDQLASRVLLAQRRRFRGTSRAEEASFLLGRLADGPAGRTADALAWYERYLREAPSGVYAAEAMGRMMLVLERQQRNDEARTLATEYLRRFPHGPYARAAHGLAPASAPASSPSSSPVFMDR